MSRDADRPPIDPELLDADLWMAARLRAMTRLHAGLAHDVRSPQNSIALTLALLEQSLGEDGEHREWLGTIRSELGRLGRAVDGILAQSAPAPAEPGRFDLRGVLATLGELLRPQAKQQRVDVEIEPPAEPGWVDGRRHGVEQALLQVAVNALEAMPGGGRLVIRDERRGGEARIVVSDTGPGIPAEHRDEIFRRHFTTKRPAATGEPGEEAGTGLGLYLARAAVEARGGSLELLKSGAGGATFRARLPLASEAGP